MRQEAVVASWGLSGGDAPFRGSAVLCKSSLAILMHPALLVYVVSCIN